MAVKLSHLTGLYGTAGAREKFEELTVQLIRSERPDARRIRIVHGDGGIDAHTGSLVDPKGVDVFQVKYFPDEIGDSQKEQIRESFSTAAKSKEFTVKSWTLCVPIDLSLAESKWFDSWRKKRPIPIGPAWDATKLEGLLYAEKNRGIKETFFKEEHLTHIRETHQKVDKIARDLDERTAPPEPIILDPCLRSVHAGKAFTLDGYHTVIEIAFRFDVFNLSANQPARAWHLVPTFTCAEADRIVQRDTCPRLSVSKCTAADPTILPTLSEPAKVYLGIVLRPDWPIIRQIAGAFEHLTMMCRTISESHVGEDKPIAFQEKVNWDELMQEVRTGLISAGMK